MAALPEVLKVERRKNPSRRFKPTTPGPKFARKLAEAERFYEDFHWGDQPQKNVVRKVPRPPRVGVKLGRVHSIAYETRKGGEKAIWEHEFGEEGGRKPDLVMDQDTRKLYLIGGTYKIKPEGIVD